MVKFSIIIPTYNRVNFLKHSISSALEQDFEDFEVIVVDDASTDGTEEVVKSIKSDKLAYIKKSMNGERAAARNTGTNAARGEFVYFHDSDDLLYPNHLKEAEKLILSEPETVFFVLGYEIKEGNKVISRINDFSGNLNERIIKGNFLSCKVFVQRDIALNFPFNEDRELSGSEDYELWLRLAARYMLNYSTTITSALILHQGRSVQNEDPEKLIKRVSILEEVVVKDDRVYAALRKYFSDFKSDNLSYISLHLAMSGHKMLAFKCLSDSLTAAPLRLISTRRFYAIVKKLLLPL
jgi:glycosyltransferase involved in cell wall biosynthesis